MEKNLYCCVSGTRDRPAPFIWWNNFLKHTKCNFYHFLTVFKSLFPTASFGCMINNVLGFTLARTTFHMGWPCFHWSWWGLKKFFLPHAARQREYLIWPMFFFLFMKYAWSHENCFYIVVLSSLLFFKMFFFILHHLEKIQMLWALLIWSLFYSTSWKIWDELDF